MFLTYTAANLTRNMIVCTYLQMHGYDIHGPPPPMTRLDIDPGPVDMMHPDSTDSFVTYLESDDSLHNDTSSP